MDIDVIALICFCHLFSPQEEVIKPVICMDIEGFGKNVSLCLFKYWCNEEARELACVLAKLISTPNPTLKKRSSR